LTDDVFENVDVSNCKFERIVFELLTWSISTYTKDNIVFWNIATQKYKTDIMI